MPRSLCPKPKHLYMPQRVKDSQKLIQSFTRPMSFSSVARSRYWMSLVYSYILMTYSYARKLLLCIFTTSSANFSLVCNIQISINATELMNHTSAVFAFVIFDS